MERVKKIRAVIFDMDGVLIDATEWHYESLNKALEIFGTTISRSEHLSTYNGLPTKVKLEMLSSEKKISRKFHGLVKTLKQKFMLEAVTTNCRPTHPQQDALLRLFNEGYKMAVASNSVRESVELMMDRSNLSQYLEFFLSGEDVKRTKPDPAIYKMAIKRLGLQPHEVVIVEDNHYGLQAARKAGGHVLQVNKVEDTNYNNIQTFISQLENGS